MPKNYRIISRGTAVREARIKSNLSPEELASKANISRTTLSQIENGYATSVETAHRIANVVRQGFEALFEIVSKNSGNGDDPST